MLSCKPSLGSNVTGLSSERFSFPVNSSRPDDISLKLLKQTKCNYNLA